MHTVQWWLLKGSQAEGLKQSWKLRLPGPLPLSVHRSPRQWQHGRDGHSRCFWVERTRFGKIRTHSSGNITVLSRAWGWGVFPLWWLRGRKLDQEDLWIPSLGSVSSELCDHRKLTISGLVGGEKHTTHYPPLKHLQWWGDHYPWMCPISSTDYCKEWSSSALKWNLALWSFHRKFFAVPRLPHPGCWLHPGEALQNPSRCHIPMSFLFFQPNSPIFFNPSSRLLESLQPARSSPYKFLICCSPLLTLG